MGTISLEHSSRLYWLGRYTERTFRTLEALQGLYDKTIDDPIAYTTYLATFGLPDSYDSSTAFFHCFLYDKNNCDAVAYSLERAYDNGIVLREAISSEALSFLQIAKDTLKRSEHADNILLSLLPLKDTFYSFWGCIMDQVYDEEAWNLIFCGKSMERLMLSLRLKAPYAEVSRIFQKLCRRLRFVPEGTPYRCDPERLEKLTAYLSSETEYNMHTAQAIHELERIFEVSP